MVRAVEMQWLTRKEAKPSFHVLCVRRETAAMDITEQFASILVSHFICTMHNLLTENKDNHSFLIYVVNKAYNYLLYYFLNHLG